MKILQSVTVYISRNGQLFTLISSTFYRSIQYIASFALRITPEKAFAASQKLPINPRCELQCMTIFFRPPAEDRILQMTPAAEHSAPEFLRRA
ncbi:hypothetical protein AB4Z25_09375 [Rhizobium sp. RAF36]|uniref:hypothetical protein n=1 Tax=Rhizobium sp. RAF36 TaxID=3233055 RepID=UPI0013AEFCEE